MNAHVADGVCPFTLSVRLCFNSGTAGRVLMEFVWTLYYWKRPQIHTLISYSPQHQHGGSMNLSGESDISATY